MIKKDVTPQDIVHGVQTCVIPLGPLNLIADHLVAKGMTEPGGDLVLHGKEVTEFNSKRVTERWESVSASINWALISTWFAAR